MPLHKLRIETSDLAAGQAALRVLEDASDPIPLAVTLFEARPPAFVLEGYYQQAPALETVAALLGGLDGLGLPSLEAVPDANWVALSQAALPPVRAGRFVVHGSHDRARFLMRRPAVEIEAGEAFGSGHNATTTLCLEALDRLARTRRFARVLDLGCGSGVLAIAAARALPAAQVLASDNDPVAAAIALGNARLNRVGRRVRVVTVPGFSHPALRRQRAFDLVLANILPGPLIAMAGAMRHALADGGTAILSGLLDHQVREVQGVYGAHGFRLLRRTRSSGWAALALVNTGS